MTRTERTHELATTGDYRRVRCIIEQYGVSQFSMEEGMCLYARGLVNGLIISLQYSRKKKEQKFIHASAERVRKSGHLGAMALVI